MNCKKIKDIIITDYIDGQLTSRIRQQIDGHLDRCEECRAFAQKVKETVVLPFKPAAQPEDPPEFVWERIRSSVQKEESLLQRIGRKAARYVCGILYLPRPALAAVLSVVVLFVVVSSVQIPALQRKTAVNSYLSEQLVYLASLDAGTLNGNNNGDTFDMGTDIEEFLF
ncbi:MAG: zf-HC2 domain-containing protein [Candidatus Omnitrophica bacterium]|nr:zf-HC2 domain-containing protein [Candidatus Omnitrophota bacterium]